MAIRSAINEFRARLSRRRVLQIGALGGFGLALPQLFAAESTGKGPHAKSCILVFYYGGPSHLDTWDMKPQAPAEVRGEFRPISTSAPDIQICEHMPLTARVADRLCIVRSVHHPMRNHNAAASQVLTGRTPVGGDLPLLADTAASDPCYGSVLSYVLRDAELPLSHVALPHVMYNVVQLPGQSAGYLGSAYERFQIQGNPNAESFRVSALQMPPGMSPARLKERDQVLKGLGKQPGEVPHATTDRFQTYYEQAFSLLESNQVRDCFDLGKETPTTRERYGRNLHGQSMLLGRRLIEAGVRCVTVFDHSRNSQTSNWDSHLNNFARHRDALIPPVDRGFSALIEDLDDRGLLESTLVIGMGEFGRTPKINANAGRDHCPDCFSVVLAGGGVRGGTVYGSSDSLGAYPETNPATTGDLAATLYAHFGFDPATEVHDILGRPHRIADGKPVTEIFA